MARKISIYLDTSVISHLEQEDAPEKMHDTRVLWNQFISHPEKYDIVISDVTLREVSDAPEPKRTQFLEHLAEINYTNVEITSEIVDLANKIIELHILSPKSFDDCQHIAAAVTHECDYIASWNFKHIVNIRTINGVRAITSLEGYKEIDIVSPPFLIDEGD